MQYSDLEIETEGNAGGTGVDATVNPGWSRSPLHPPPVSNWFGKRPSLGPQTTGETAVLLGEGSVPVLWPSFYLVGAKMLGRQQSPWCCG